MVYSGHYEFSPANNMELAALKGVLSIKITQQLREEESEVYSPNVQLSYDKYPKNRYLFTVSFGCTPKM
jgi:zinc protease